MKRIRIAMSAGIAILWLIAGAVPAEGEPEVGTPPASSSQQWKSSREQGLAALTQMGRSLKELERGLKASGASKDELRKVRDLRASHARTVQQFKKEKPPRAGSDASAPVRAQDHSQQYTQFVQLSTQLMSELQSTERELIDALQTMRRDLDSFQAFYAAMRDTEFRTNERIIRNIR